MILIQNKQRSIRLSTPALRATIKKILTLLGYADYDIGVLLVSNKAMHHYNLTYRGKDKPTDVLSFPFHQAAPGKLISPSADDEKNLGDIILAPLYIKKDAACWGHSFEQRMNVLLVHGICHLLGYDHIEDADFKRMQKKERELLKEIDPTVKI